MKVYFYNIKFSFFRFFTYPFEIIANVLKRLMNSVFFILLWFVIQKSGSINLDFNKLISYYLIVSGISELIMGQWGSFGKVLGNSIRTGNLNSILIKPVNAALFIFSNSIGESGMRIITGAIVILLGVLVSPSANLESLIVLLTFTFLGILVSFAINLFEGTIFFYIPDASGIRSGINHIKGLLGGLMIPIFLFPESVKNLIQYNPFAVILYYPANALNVKLFSDEYFKFLIVGIFWAILLNLLFYFFWMHSLKKYEGVGI